MAKKHPKQQQQQQTTGNSHHEKPAAASAPPPRSSSSSSSSFLSKPILLFAVVAVAIGVGMSMYMTRKQQQQTKSSGSVSSSSSSHSSKKKHTATLTPATEMERGLPGTLQRELYDDGVTAFATVALLNDNGTLPYDVFWNGRLLAMVAPGFRTNLETWVGHEFLIGGEHVVVDGTFDAYVPSTRQKASLSSFPPFSRQLNIPPRVVLRSLAKAIKIRNLSGRTVHEFWVPDDEGAQRVYQGVVEPNSETTTNSYSSHRFQFTDLKNKNKILYDFRVNTAQDVYAYVDEKTADPYLLRSHLEELALAESYKARTGRSWLSYYPHEPVKTFLWPADEIGQVHTVKVKNMPGGGEGELKLEVLSTEPRIFRIKNIMSQEEADEVIRLAKQRMQKSSVQAKDEKGNIVPSDTRTSKNAWVERDPNNPIIDTLFRRASEVLRVNDTIMTHRAPDGICESLQVVHYKNSAHYSPHHDWGVHKSPHTRLMTLLFYLNEPPRGGGKTAFPKAQVGKDDGLRIHPGPLHGILFYSQYPDGNVNDFSLHEAEAVSQGEKWLSNMWIHDAVYWQTTSE